MSQRRVVAQDPTLVVDNLPGTEVQHEAVQEQLEKLLAHPFFSHSKRYPLLLRSVVERALDGRADQLKERTLGVEVFGRDPDYDTNADPVVRVAAGEIRKRIAQYYHEPGHENEIRIELPCGTYLPEFHRSASLIPEEPAGTAPAPNSLSRPSPLRLVARRLFTPIYLALLTVSLLAYVSLSAFSVTSVDRFWQPFWNSPGTPLLCLGDIGFPRATGGHQADTQTMSVTDQIHHEYVDFSDVTTFSRLAGLFQAKGKPYNMQIGSATTFYDLRNGPVVLVGGFNNAWTLRLLSQLRFSLAREHCLQWIQDRQTPTRRDWMVDVSVPYLKLSGDYAIISRLVDPATEKMVVVAAGIAQYGTTAAGEFLTNPRYLDELAKQAPPNWQHRNLQVVIATEVINGNSGPPRILATHFW